MSQKRPILVRQSYKKTNPAAQSADRQKLVNTGFGLLILTNAGSKAMMEERSLELLLAPDEEGTETTVIKILKTKVSFLK